MDKTMKEIKDEYDAERQVNARARCSKHRLQSVFCSERFDKNIPKPEHKEVREFQTGATRSPLSDKLQYEGFISPIVLKRYAEYMHKHRTQNDDTTRDADNWQKGIPSESALDSMLRHVMDVWLDERGYSGETSETVLDSLCAIIFNASIIILNRERENANRN